MTRVWGDKSKSCKYNLCSGPQNPKPLCGTGHPLDFTVTITIRYQTIRPAEGLA